MFKKMKGFIFICMLAYVRAYNFEVLMVGVEEAGNACIPTVGAAADDLSAIINHQVPATYEGKCLLSCMHKKYGLQSQDGALNKEGVMKYITPLKDTDPEAYEELVSVFEKCLDEVPNDDDECKTAANFKQCVLDNMKNL